MHGNTHMNRCMLCILCDCVGSGDCVTKQSQEVAHLYTAPFRTGPCEDVQLRFRLDMTRTSRACTCAAVWRSHSNTHMVGKRPSSPS